MTIFCKLKDGSTISISGFKFDTKLLNDGFSGLKIGIDDVRQHLITINYCRRKNGIPERDLTDIADLIYCAEAQFMLIDDDGEEICSIPYGESPTFWAKRA